MKGVTVVAAPLCLFVASVEPIAAYHMTR